MTMPTISDRIEAQARESTTDHPPERPPTNTHKGKENIMENKKHNLTALPLEKVIEGFEEIRRGTFHHISFFSLPSTIDGRTIYKISTTELQAKIDHTHGKNYEEPSFHRTEDSTYIVDNGIKFNNKTQNYLVTIVPNMEKYKSVYADENGIEIPKEEAEKWLKPKKKSNKPISFMTPKATQILYIH